MTQFGAFFVNLFIAHLVYIGHIFPPFKYLTFGFKVIEKAVLSKIFHDDVLTLDITTSVVHSTVFSI
jgi:hypothetical protein